MAALGGCRVDQRSAQHLRRQSRRRGRRQTRFSYARSVAPPGDHLVLGRPSCGDPLHHRHVVGCGAGPERPRELDGVRSAHRRGVSATAMRPGPTVEAQGPGAWRFRAQEDGGEEKRIERDRSDRGKGAKCPVEGTDYADQDQITENGPTEDRSARERCSFDRRGRLLRRPLRAPGRQGDRGKGRPGHGGLMSESSTSTVTTW